MIRMTEDALLAVRRSNLNIMRRELYTLKTEADALYNEWLNESGEYLTATRMAWAKYYEKAREYKELWFKLVANEKKVG